jgi:aerobic carbon-monoxide dehydrogenase large subunit
MDGAIGKPVRRKEDRRLLTGNGKFSDDFNLPNQAYLVMVRSVHAHARLTAIHTDAALAMPGVRAVLTGQDVLDDGINPVPHDPLPGGRNDLKLVGRNGGPLFDGPHYFLPADKARHAGEAVAAVIADTLGQAKDAAEAVVVDYDVLPHVTITTDTVKGGAPVVWDEAPDNTPVDVTTGDKDSADAIFETADHVVRMEFDIGRVTGVPMEPRAAIGDFDDATGYTLYAGSGGAVRQQNELAGAFGVDKSQIRVVVGDVGGNFGTRNRVYPEFGVVMWAAKRIGRPVKYVCDRSEAFISDYQGRDLVTHVEMALDAQGNFLAFRADNISNVGARIVSLSPLGKGSHIVTGCYKFAAGYVRSRAVFSNTPPTQAYRSSGRPEVTHAIERLIDTAAHELGFDPLELRRRNLVASSDMPYVNPIGAVYDSGEYAKNMDMVLELSDWDGFVARKAGSAARGRLRGMGLANYVESSTGAPRERAEITVKPDGEIDLVIGTQPSGQGHETSFSQVAAEWLGVDVGCINVLMGDTKFVSVGGGSHSGRSMRLAGNVIVKAADAIIAKGKRMAGHIMEADAGDIEFKGGAFIISGTDRSLGIFELAARAADADLPDDLQGGLAVGLDNEMHVPVFPNGSHVCEVEIDTDTGVIELVRYTAIDDVGRAINPMIVDGQTHGGIVQGLGQAMCEAWVCDPVSGQPLSGSFMDYGMPRADMMPSFATALNEVPSPTNPLGVKAGGEGGTTPSLAVYINAIVNVLRDRGVRDITLPATPLRMWEILHGKN